MTYSRSTWRNIAAPIIARVIREHGTDNMPALRRALREAYPWGERTMHPYKIWRDKIRRQLAGGPPLDTRRPSPVAPGQLAIPTDCEGGAETPPAAATPAPCYRCQRPEPDAPAPADQKP